MTTDLRVVLVGAPEPEISGSVLFRVMSAQQLVLVRVQQDRGIQVHFDPARQESCEQSSSA